MLLDVLLFGFFAIGVKIVLAVGVLYCMLPGRGTCERCDADTLAVRPRRGLEWAYRAVRLQQRWCPACGESQHARATHGPFIRVADSGIVRHGSDPARIGGR